MSDLHLPDIHEDEDGVWYYAEGHVDLRLFRDAVIAFELVEGGLQKTDLSTLDPDFNPRHVWMRYLREDEAHYNEYEPVQVLCEPGDDGATAWTVVTHD